MSDFGFTIGRLRATNGSKEVPPAEIEFKPGFNVISGLSNTGKSYVFHCLDYMLGNEKPPVSINESQPYIRLYLEIEDRNHQIYTLERSLKGGDFHLYKTQISDIGYRSTPTILKGKPDATRQDNISSFFLSLSGIETPVKIKKNKNNETENLTFRTISHLFLVNETNIIDKASPVLHKNVYTTSKMKSAFNFLLTGVDDSSLIASPDKALQQAQRQAKKEVYDLLISDLEQKVKINGKEVKNIAETTRKVKARIEQLSDSIRSSNQLLMHRQQMREEAWAAKQEADSRVIVRDELLIRFNLLKEHYESDLRRLEFISEGDYFFEQLESVNCPLCGNAIAQHAFRKRCIDRGNELVDIQRASLEEAAKIRTQLRDLNDTVSKLVAERESFTTISQEKNLIIQECDRIIAEELKPKEVAANSELERLLTGRRILAELELNSQRLQELREARALLEKVPKDTKPKGQASSVIDTFALRKLGDIIETILEEWKFPSLGTVEFNESQMDLVIGGKPRQHNGKGIRAILHAAFVIGLMRYCKEYNKPHPCIVVLDSPLTTLREEGTETEDSEEVSGEVQAAFFSHLASTPYDEQIVVLENKVPSQGVKGRINFIEFVGQYGNGRAGFYPPLRY